MRHRIAAVAIAAAVAGTGLMASPAQAGNRCVSRKEYRRIERGMTKRRVHRIFDFNGSQSMHYIIGGTVYQMRDYKTCTISYGVRGWVGIDYKDGRVRSKSAVW